LAPPSPPHFSPLSLHDALPISRASEQMAFLDLDTQAILFLCCSHHVVPCQKCQNTYRLSWIPRVDRGLFPCPLCGNDLTPTVVADRKSTRLNSSHLGISYAVFC